MTRYWGGKARTGRQIAQAILDDERVACKSHAVFWDPFCGMLGVTRHILASERFRSVVISDVNDGVVGFWRAFQAGWEPKTQLSPGGYAALRATKERKTPMHILVGHACGYRGKYFEFKKPSQDYISTRLQQAQKSLHKIRATLHAHAAQVQLETLQQDFFAIPDSTTGVVFYLDPPFVATSSRRRDNGHAGLFEDFDNKRFWQKATQLAQGGKNLVFVSEVAQSDAPDPHWKPVWSIPSGLAAYPRNEVLWSYFP